MIFEFEINKAFVFDTSCVFLLFNQYLTYSHIFFLEIFKNEGKSICSLIIAFLVFTYSVPHKSFETGANDDDNLDPISEQKC